MILIVTNKERSSESLCSSLGYMGYLAVGVTEKEISATLDERFSACIIPDPESLASAEDTVKRIHALKGDIPIFALLDTPSYAPYTRIMQRGATASELIRAMIRYSEEYGTKRIGMYSAMGLDLSPERTGSEYYFSEISFTRTEAQIIRLLIASHPAECSAELIVRYVFRPSRRPEVSSIRTHISAINKKFRHAFKRNLIEAVPTVGYRLITPDITEDDYIDEKETVGAL